MKLRLKISIIISVLAVQLIQSSSFAQSAFEFLKARNSDRVIGVRPIIPIALNPAVTSSRVSVDMTDPLLLADSILEVMVRDYGVFVDNVSSDLKVINAEKDKDTGITRVTYKQVLKDLDISGREVTVYFNNKNELIYIKGNTKKSIQAPTVPLVDAASAITAAQTAASSTASYRHGKKKFKDKERKKCNRKYKNNKKRKSCVKAKLTQFEINNIPPIKVQPKLLIKSNDSTDKDYLIWEMTLLEGTENGRIYHIDAVTGNILTSRLDVHFADEPNRYSLDCGHNLPQQNECYFNKVTFSYGFEFYFGRSEGKPARGPSPVPDFLGSTDVDYFYENVMQKLHYFYRDKFGRDGGNGVGGTPFYVTGNPYSLSVYFLNANNTDIGRTACVGNYPLGWQSELGLHFCKGSRQYDLIGHEYAHIVSSHLMVLPGNVVESLGGTGETGSLSESFSDIMGEAVEKYITGSNNWYFFPEAQTAGRNLQNPAISTYHEPGVGFKNYPDRYGSPNYYCGSNDQRGVYTNSTIPSKAAYLAAEGGSFNGCQVHGIGLEKVQKIWYTALTQYFSTGETFNDAYFSLIEACNQLVTTDPWTFQTIDCDNLAEALQAVEMDQDLGCVGGVPKAAAPATCRSHSIQGDFDHNGIVDLWDYNVFKKEFLQFAFTTNADADKNGYVEAFDFYLWEEAYEDVTGLPSPPFPEITGDCDGDGQAEGSDFLKWQRTVGQTGPALACDNNADGVINGTDLQIWSDSF